MRETIPAPFDARQGTFARFGLPLTIGAVGLASVALLIASGNPALALAPVGLAAFVAFLFHVPLRWSAAGLVLAIFVLDETQEAVGQWQTPLAKLGDILLYRIDSTIPVPAGFLSGMEIMAIVLLAIRAHRLASRSELDESGRVVTPRITRELLWISFAGVALAEAYGMARGFSAVPYKLKYLLDPLLLTAAFLAAFRGPSDAILIGKIIVFAAGAKGILAVIVQQIAKAETGGMFASAVSHGDSILFSIGAALIILWLVEAPRRGRLIPALALLAPIIAGSFQNNRRLVWVMLAMSLLVAYLIRPLTGWQRMLTKAALVSIPIALLYVALGWNSSSKVFAPVVTLRSVSDPGHDSSAYWREVEIWNISTSMRQNSIMGMGLGGEYTEYMFNDDISEGTDGYKEYKEWPHNTVLGLLMLMGLFGFTTQWILFPAILFLAIRSYWLGRSADERMVALGCIVAVVGCLVMAWGDTGAHYIQFKVALALAFAFASKLAIQTGAWPMDRSA